MKLAQSTVAIAVLSFVAVLSIQPSTHARTWACRKLGIGCPQTIRGTSPNPPSPPEPIGFQICNNSSANPIYVSFVIKKEGGFSPQGLGASPTTTSQGWQNLRSGECQVVHSGNASDVVAIYAQGSGKFWGNSDEYCIHPTNPFTFGSQANYSRGECQSQGGQMVPFFRTRNTSRFFSFTLN